MTVSIQLSAQLDAQGLQAQLTDITRRINATGDAIAKANRVQFNPISQATVQQAQRLQTTVANIKTLLPDLHRRIQASGQGTASWDQFDFGRMYSNAQQAARSRQNLFTMATGLGFGGSTVTPPPGQPLVPAQGGSRPGGGQHLVPAQGGSGGGGGQPSFGGQALNTALTNAGMLGRATAGGLQASRQAMAGGAGLGGGIRAGIGFGVGNLALNGIGAIVGGIASHVGEAQQLSIMQADLYRRIGGRGTGNSYDILGDAVRGTSNAIGVDYQEAYGLAGMAARRSGVTNTRELTELVGTGGGFGRAYGFDPSAGVSAFASMRGVGVTRNNEDNRRLGIAIAEGIARAGVFARAEEFLSEIANYGEQTTRATLTRANVEGYAEALTALVGSGIPGMDPRGAAALLGRADQAIRGGGAAGEAGQAFLYQVLGRETGLDPMQVHALQEGGLFATGRNTFGRDAQGRLAVAGQHYADNGIAVRGGLAEDDTTNLERIMAGVRSRYTGANARLRAPALANLLGLNQRQAMAMDGLKPEDLRGFARAGLTREQLNSMSETGIAMVGRIGASDDAGLNSIAEEMKGRTGRAGLNAAERERLNAAQRSGNAEDLRKTLTELAAIKGAQETEGDKTRASLQGINKAITDAASLLVGPLNTAAETLLVMSGSTRRGITERRLKMDVAEAGEDRTRELAELNGRGDDIARRLSDATSAANTAPAGPLREAAEARQRTIMEEQQQLERDRLTIENRHSARVSGLQATANPSAVQGEVAGRARHIRDLYRQHGGDILTDAAATALAANAVAESGAQPNGGQGDGGRSAGILQWNNNGARPGQLGRRAQFSAMFDKDISQATVEEQVRFSVHELRTTEAAALRQIQQARTSAEAAAIVSNRYLRPANRDGTEPGRRASIAAGLEQTWAGRPPAGTPTQATPLPAGAPPAAVQNAPAAAQGTQPSGGQPAVGPQSSLDLNVTGQFALVDSRGNPIPAIATVNPVIAAARPSGSRPRAFA